MLSHLVRLGDRVAMNMDFEALVWGRKGVPDGTLGTVMGRELITDHIEPRWPRLDGIEPGIYRHDGNPIIRWDAYPAGVDPMDDDYSKVNAVSLRSVENSLEYNERYQREWVLPLRSTGVSSTKLARQLDRYERIGDLPETPFWELDSVAYQNRRYRVDRISYPKAAQDRAIFYKLLEIDALDQDLPRELQQARAEDLRLLGRGNLWKEAHNEPLIFTTLTDEVQFAYNTGRMTQILSLDSGNYGWRSNSAWAALCAGTVDYFTGLTHTSSSMAGYRCENRELGDRVRAVALGASRPNAIFQFQLS